MCDISSLQAQNNDSTVIKYKQTLKLSYSCKRIGLKKLLLNLYVTPKLYIPLKADIYWADTINMLENTEHLYNL